MTRFRLYRTSDPHQGGHVEIEDLPALLAWAKAAGEPVILTVEDDIAPSLEIYDDYRE